MEKNVENVEKAPKKKGMAKVRIVFSSMLLFILFLAEIYLMLNSSAYFEGLVTVTVLLIAVLYILVTSVIQVNYEKEQKIFDEFEDIYKSEKAAYMLMRKNFEEINERLAYLEDNAKTHTEEIIAAQKAIAKVNISRNKENTDALMNSNDKLLERFFSFEDLITTNSDKLVDQQKLIMDQANKEILIKQQEAISKIKELELSIKNQILQSMNAIVSGNPNSTIDLKSVDSEVSSMDDFLNDESEFSSTEDFFGEEEPEVSSMDEILESESELSVTDDLSDTESELTSMDEFLKEEMEPEISAEGESDAEEAISEVVEEEPEEEPEPVTEAAEEKPAAPDMSDPNKMMTPDDIAALLATVGNEESAAETEKTAEESAPEPEQTVEAAEEKPAMPDMSDPNKMMSPEDIAALLANM